MHEEILTDGARGSDTLVPRAFDTIVLGGLAVGVLDMFDAFTFFGWYLGPGIQPVFQGVAAGVLGGETARAGGWETFALGLGLHYCVAVIIAAVFYLAARALPVLLRYPLISGPVYGIICHFVMQLVVIPLSAIGRMPNFTLRTTLNGIIGHALLVGLPVAIIAARSANRRRS